jgi:integrase
MMKKRSNGEKLWEFRFYEINALGKRQRRALTVGRVADYPSESAVRNSPLVQGLLLRMNSGDRTNAAPTVVEGVLGRYETEEMPERHSTRVAYQSMIKKHIRRAGVAANLGSDIGWHTFRHSYRSWLDETGAPMSVQKQLMRHATIQTTMNVYGKAMSDTKREAHGRVVDRLLVKPSAGIGS